ncbi:MAG: hypothetical protein IT285_16245 [Bdellovibrionales bacterium]|nr:hypothetical protein [Bdellovibrionales bacterium]
MAKSVVLSGANIVLYVNNKKYNEVRSVNLVVDYGEQEIYGIDADYPQEIAPGRVTVRGQVQGVRVKFSGGLQAFSLRPLFQDRYAGNYVSIRIQDRDTEEDIVYVPNAKVSRETHVAAAKGVYSLSFDFAGQIPYFALDRA